MSHSNPSWLHWVIFLVIEVSNLIVIEIGHSIICHQVLLYYFLKYYKIASKQIHKSALKFFFKLGCKIVVNIFVFPILSPLFSFNFFWGFVIVCLIIKNVPSYSNSSKSSSSSSNNLRT